MKYVNPSNDILHVVYMYIVVSCIAHNGLDMCSQYTYTYMYTEESVIVGSHLNQRSNVVRVRGRTLIESQNEPPDFGQVSTHAVDTLNLQAKRLDKLQTLVD